MWLEHLLHHCIQTTWHLFALKPLSVLGRSMVLHDPLRNLYYDKHLPKTRTILGLEIKLTYAHEHILDVH